MKEERCSMGCLENVDFQDVSQADILFLDRNPTIHETNDTKNISALGMFKRAVIGIENYEEL